MIKVGIIGATGFTGEKLAGLLLDHPQAEITYISAKVDAPAPFSSIFPYFKGRMDLVCDNLDVEKACALTDVVFLSLPHRVSFLFVPHFLKKSKRVIDLSADYRLEDPAVYKTYYGSDHQDTENLSKAVYGLPEFFKDKIEKAQLIANPGCYPTVSILSLAPLVKEGIVETKGIVIDAKSGITGAGRNASLAYHYAHLNQDLWAYKVFGHQHLPEITQVLEGVSEKDLEIQFSPHVVGMERGILATMYVTLAKSISSQAVMSLYEKYYTHAPFVRVFEKLPHLKDTLNTNFCDIGFTISGKKMVIVGCIDNLIKGASGQAIQNMNIMLGLDEKEGLR